MSEPKPLQVPDLVGLKHVQEVCSWPDPYDAPSESAPKFVKAMKEIVGWHSARSEFYRNFLRDNKFDIATWSGDLASLPFITADFFKAHELRSISDKDVTLHLTSSGTTGQKSQIFFDSWSIGCAQRMIDFIFQKYGWVTKTPANYLLYSYQPQEGSKLGTAYTDNFLTKYAPVKNVHYALKWNGKNGHDFDLYGCIRALQEFEDEGAPVRIFGFPAFFYFTLQRMIDLGLPPLKLHEESLVFLGGGWKSHAEQAIEKFAFYKLVEQQLGIPQKRLRDGFGSVEHCIPYVECEKHQFHIPVWSKVIIRDLRTLRPLGYGERGFLQFVSPYITSVPAHSIMMGDLAILREGASCACGLNTDWFEILGRAGVSKNKSCAIAAAELLRGFS